MYLSFSSLSNTVTIKEGVKATGRVICLCPIEGVIDLIGKKMVSPGSE
jgi:hypothetical protein